MTAASSRSTAAGSSTSQRSRDSMGSILAARRAPRRACRAFRPSPRHRHLPPSSRWLPPAPGRRHRRRRCDKTASSVWTNDAAGVAAAAGGPAPFRGTRRKGEPCLRRTGCAAGADWALLVLAAVLVAGLAVGLTAPWPRAAARRRPPARPSCASGGPTTRTTSIRSSATSRRPGRSSTSTTTSSSASTPRPCGPRPSSRPRCPRRPTAASRPTARRTRSNSART